MKFTASGQESPQAAQFRVAVDENGAVRHCFLEQSSGDAELDDQARKHLVLCRFSATATTKSGSQDDFVWGTATFAWGNDIAAPARATESVAP
jgi:TonB family protein